MIEIKFEFEIDERVEIIELARTGAVVNLGSDGSRVCFTVRYFDNGTPQTVVFYEDELRHVKGK